MIAVPAMLLRPGTRLGPYEVESAIGSGGMGQVYRARDTRLDRTVAIKILPDELAADDERPLDQLHHQVRDRAAGIR